MRKLLLVMIMCSSATADTFVPTDGHVTSHPGRCVSKLAIDHLQEFIDRKPQITAGKKQMTVHTDAPARDVSADRLLLPSGNMAEFDLPDNKGVHYKMTIDVQPVGFCTESRTCATYEPTIRLAVTAYYAGMKCYEEWSGRARKL